MKYAPVIVYDEDNTSWAIVGIVGVNCLGVAKMHVQKDHELVARTPAYGNMEAQYNNKFEGKSLDNYDNNENGESFIHRYSTEDENFLEVFKEMQNAGRGVMRIGEIQDCDNENLNFLDQLMLRKKEMFDDREDRDIEDNVG